MHPNFRHVETLRETVYFSEDGRIVFARFHSYIHVALENALIRHHCY